MSKDRRILGQDVAEKKTFRTSEIPQPTIVFRIPTAQEEWDRCLLYYDSRASFNESFSNGAIFHYLRLPTQKIKIMRGNEIGGYTTLGGYNEPNSAFSNFYEFGDSYAS